MPNWIPRWHPVWWAIVIIVGYLIWTDPAEWGHKVGGMLHYIPVIASRVGVFFQSI